MYTKYAVGAVSALGIGAQAAFSGAHYSLNAPDQLEGNVAIEGMQTTLVVPEAPDPPMTRLYLWPGIQTHGTTTQGALIQSIAASFMPGTVHTPYQLSCGDEDWCAFNFNFIHGHSTPGEAAPITSGDHLVIEYIREDPNYRQTITLNGKVIAEMTAFSDGEAYGFYTAVECQLDFNGIAPAHTYLNTTFSLDSPHPQFDDRLKSRLVDASPLYSPDGGLTWKVDSIQVQESHCDATDANDPTHTSNSTDTNGTTTTGATSSPSGGTDGNDTTSGKFILEVVEIRDNNRDTDNGPSNQNSGRSLHKSSLLAQDIYTILLLMVVGIYFFILY